MIIRAISLQSGSNGNCIYVETSGVRLLFDAGLSGVDAERRLAAYGRKIREVDAVIISHDHSDHVRHAGTFQRKFGLPIYITRDTLDVALARHRLGRLSNVRHFNAGEPIRIGDVTIQTIPTPHDGADGVVFVIECCNKKLGIMTDLGHVFDGLRREIPNLDAVFIESNYDPTMLTKGPYPSYLKKRISGPRGHISNFEAADLLLSGKRLKWACLSHLSHHNNYPALAIKTHRAILPESLTLHLAGRSEATAVLGI
ncbi:MAG TPA: MBL fold metallo-hydrolase [Dissulfurispiraceae bacterium]|nr:MBL fold metallo-hydrolase [Dissulfurispiraceae bacterium]